MSPRMILCALSGVAAFGCAAQADVVLYQQTIDQQSSLNSQYTSGASLRRTADDFVLTTGNTLNYSVTQLHVFLHSAYGAADPTRYGVEVYADNNGAPGTRLLQILGASRTEDRGLAPSNFRIVEAYFNVNLILAPNTRYWITGFGRDGTAGQTRFSTSDYGGTAVGLTARYLMSDGSWAPVETAAGAMYRDFAFSVYGNQLVPAPAGAGLLGIAVLAAGRRKRR